jgi:hypothetical protein
MANQRWQTKDGKPILAFYITINGTVVMSRKGNMSPNYESTTYPEGKIENKGDPPNGTAGLRINSLTLQDNVNVTAYIRVDNKYPWHIPYPMVLHVRQRKYNNYTKF